MLPETKYAPSGDIYIAYQVTGDGPVDLLWAPGTVSHLDLDWDSPVKSQFIKRLSTFCRLIRFDKRGTGLSDRPIKMATLEQRTDDIRTVMDAVGSPQATVMGMSEGASMACLFAATYPERTRSLIVWGGQARWVKTDDYPWGSTPEEYALLIEKVQEGWPSTDYILGPGAGFGKDIDPALLRDAIIYTGISYTNAEYTLLSDWVGIILGVSSANFEMGQRLLNLELN